MKLFHTSLLVQILILCIRTSIALTIKDAFPEDFVFGVATAAYKIEGGWNASGKGESAWDRYVHTLHERGMKPLDGTTGDVGSDFYNNYETDVKLMKHLGLQFYRFSIAWTRIITAPPYFTEINQEGLRFYNSLIDLLIENGIEPMVTIFHWDAPQSLEDIGGFTNSIAIKEYVRYAKVLFDNFADRVKIWITFNDPKTYCSVGYGSQSLAPATNMPGIADYICGYNILKAHAEVYHLYNDTYKPKYNGRIAISTEGRWYDSYNKNDEEIAETVKQFQMGWFAHPIYTKKGDYPDIMKHQIASRSKSEGFPRSRLPELTDVEIKRIRGTSDFIALNYHSTQLVHRIHPVIDTPSLQNDMGANMFQHYDWPFSSTCKKITTWDVPNTLKWFKDNYGDLDIYITENGFADFGVMEDYDRINFIYLHLKEILKSIREDKIKIKGYAYWTLMDDVEWHFGSVLKFGLYNTNFTDPKRTRTAKASVEYYKNLIETRKLYKVLPCLSTREGDITTYFKSSYKRGKHDDCFVIFSLYKTKP